MKRLFFLNALLIGPLLFNVPPPTAKKHHGFYLKYMFAGMGSNLGSMMPKMTIEDDSFRFSYSQNTYWDHKTEEDRLIVSGTIHQSSIDSIWSLINHLVDSSLVRANPCVMSGGYHSLIISNGADTVRFRLINTINIQVINIFKILNQYLPPDEVLGKSADKSLAEEKECFELVDSLRRKR